jgi:hypothetical protein
MRDTFLSFKEYKERCYSKPVYLGLWASLKDNFYEVGKHAILLIAFALRFLFFVLCLFFPWVILLLVYAEYIGKRQEHLSRLKFIKENCLNANSEGEV